MVGKATIMTSDGVRELPLYYDHRDLENDWGNRALKLNDEIVYGNELCVIECEHSDEDGSKYLQLLVVGGTAVQFA